MVPVCSRRSLRRFLAEAEDVVVSRLAPRLSSGSFCAHPDQLSLAVPPWTCKRNEYQQTLERELAHRSMQHEPRIRLTA